MTFEDAVAEWLRSQGCQDVAQVISCDGRGSDWSGSTESGFYDTFGVDVVWLTADGVRGFDNITGEKMQSLWMHVVGAWGDHA